MKIWSHPPGLNRRPADYETFLKPQITENTVNGVVSTTPPKCIAALVEQVSEQVALPETREAPP